MQKWMNTFRVGHIYKCTMTYSQKGGLRAEWEPNPPSFLEGRELEQYRMGRDALLQEVAKAMGGSALVVEI